MIDHHIIFANRADVLVALATAPVNAADSLAAVSSFESFSASLSPTVGSGIYSDSSAAAEAARSGVRALLLDERGE